MIGLNAATGFVRASTTFGPLMPMFSVLDGCSSGTVGVGNHSSTCSFHNVALLLVRNPLDRQFNRHFLPSQSSGGGSTPRRSRRFLVT